MDASKPNTNTESNLKLQYLRTKYYTHIILHTYTFIQS